MSLQPTQSPVLYRPSSPHSSQTHLFRNFINVRHALTLQSYEHLWKWSVDNIALFWDTVWDYTEVVGQKGASDKVSLDSIA